MRDEGREIGSFFLANEQSTPRRYRTVLNAIGDGVLQLDPGGELVGGNDAAVELLGRTRESLLGQHVSAVVDDAADLEASIRDLRSGDREGALVEVTLRDREGEAVPCELRATPEWVDGEYRGIVCVLREREARTGDATDRENPSERGDRTPADDGDPPGLGAPDDEREEVFERITDAFYALDDQWRFTYVNDRAAELIDVTGEGLEGRTVWEAFEWAADSTIRDEYERAMEAQEPTSFEVYYPEPLDAWYEINAYPSETGLSVYFRDVTDRRAVRERLEAHNRALRRLYDVSADRDRSFDEKVEQVLALGREYLGVSDGFLAETDREADRFEVLRASGDDERLEPEAVTPLSETYCRRTIESDRLVEVAGAAADEEWVTDQAYGTWELDCYVGGTVSVDGDQFGTLCFVDDQPRTDPFTDEERRFVELATQWVGHELERRRHRERLERYREYTDEKLDALDDVFYTLDDEGRLQWWNDAFEAVTGYDAGELEGKPGADLFEGGPRERVAETIAAVFETGSGRVEAEFVTNSGEAIPYEFNASALEDPEGNRVLTGIGRDVSERKAREQALERRRRQQSVISELGQLALEGDDLDELMAETARRVADTLDTDYSKVLDLDPDARELLLRQGVGWRDGIVGTATVAADENSQAGYTLLSEEPVVVEDLETETRFSGPDLLTSHDVRSGISTIVGSVADPWGILGAHATDPRSFDEEDVDFLRSVANVLATAIERTAREEQLEAQRRRLEALDQLNGVIREVTDAAIEQSTREEIEEIVCRRLADSVSYEFAWIGDADTNSERVVPRARAGPGAQEYLDVIEVSIDPEDPHSSGPTGQAFLTGEVRTVQDVHSDPEYEPWREAAREHGFRSSAAVPIAHEGTVFGVLNVYADRQGAFAAEERELIGHLGEIVGHAVAAVERKRAMMSDEGVEVELRLRDAFPAFSGAAGSAVVDRVVPLDDERYLVFGSAEAGSEAALETLVDDLDHWSDLSADAENGAVQFEVTATESPLVGTVAAHGGVVETARIEDGDAFVTIHFPRGGEVRTVVDALEAAYHSVEPLARRQIEFGDGGDATPTLSLLEDLTDRQRTTLETAYYAGFFEWPRDASGAEIADQLDIAPATFSQHLRGAQRKLLDAVFAEVPASG